MVFDVWCIEIELFSHVGLVEGCGGRSGAGRCVEGDRVMFDVWWQGRGGEGD